jgi:hypothetical protein
MLRIDGSGALLRARSYQEMKSVHGGITLGAVPNEPAVLGSPVYHMLAAAPAMRFAGFIIAGGGVGLTLICQRLRSLSLLALSS